ncbi:MAG: C40 family peptidase [Bacteroidales bacterium]|nr:C40 family peptidase [Bacteroidales bacterium]
MLYKLSTIAFVALVTNCLHSPHEATKAGPDKPVNKPVEVVREDVIEYAKVYLGTTYHYAGINPEQGFDCSGYVYFVFKNFNIDLPRGSAEYKLLGTALKPEEFKVGDVLVFYGHRDSGQIGHVGIICEANGMKSKFIHSSSGKAYGVTISELNSEHYNRRFYKCIDVISGAGEN